MRNLNRRPQLPDALTATAALGPFFAEYDQLRREGGGLQREIEGLVREQKTAAADDRAAGAVALRQGKPDPGDRATKAIDEKSTVLRRRAGHVATAQGNILREIERELEANGASWAAEADAHTRQARRDVAAALDAYRAAWERLVGLEVSGRWLRTSGSAKPVPILADVPGLKAGNGQSYHLSDVLAALAAIDTEPAEAVDADYATEEAQAVA